MSGSTRSRAARLTVPADFDLRATVVSHGWCLLAPNAWDAPAGALARPYRVPGGVSTVVARQAGGRGAPVELEVTAGRGARSGLDGAGWEAVREAVARSLQVDRSLTEFHERCRAAGPPHDRAPALGFGRLLRSPTLFEDLVKILATTNTAWSGTKAMVANLVGTAGRGDAFPSPAEVAWLGEKGLAKARWGYRAAPLVELARAVADGRVDTARWEEWDGATEDLAAEIRGLEGFGPYATAQALMLLGRFDRIGVDSVFRAHVRKTHFAKARAEPSLARMLAVYDDWGEWRGLGYWFEVWHGHGGEESLAEQVGGA